MRETIDSEQTGDHANGAAVRFWWPLTTATRLTLSEQLDDTLGGLDWQATISGDNAPQAALRNGHLVLIQTRHEVTGDTVWSDWTNLLVGWLQSPQIRQGADGETPWEATIVSSAGMLQSIQAQGLRVGPVNAARGGSISGTQELSRPRTRPHLAVSLLAPISRCLLSKPLTAIAARSTQRAVFGHGKPEDDRPSRIR